MRILHVASEATPLAKTGGLADVVGALPAKLASLGHEVNLVLPGYRDISTKSYNRLPFPLGVPLGATEEWGAVWWKSFPTGVTVFLLEHNFFFNRDIPFELEVEESIAKIPDENYQLAKTAAGFGQPDLYTGYLNLLYFFQFFCDRYRYGVGGAFHAYGGPILSG